MHKLENFAIYSDKKNTNQIKDKRKLECNKMFCVLIENNDDICQPWTCSWVFGKPTRTVACWISLSTQHELAVHELCLFIYQQIIYFNFFPFNHFTKNVCIISNLEQSIFWRINVWKSAVKKHQFVWTENLNRTGKANWTCLLSNRNVLKIKWYFIFLYSNVHNFLEFFIHS
jgi:hypothetical protein